MDSHSPIAVFESSAWRERWAEAARSAAAEGSELGLILTRESVLRKQLAVGADEFKRLLQGLQASARRRGVDYHYLDLDSFPEYVGEGDVESVVALLRLIAAVALPKYLFILGNEQVIEVVRWQNESVDGDAVVESDLCYSTLDTRSPWNGQRYEFDAMIRVGRLPTYVAEPFARFETYFRSVEALGALDRIKPYGLSAQEWEQESNYEFGRVAAREVDVSPPIQRLQVPGRIDDGTNLMFFNLHGSNQTRYWYGQDGAEFPEAFAPSVLEGLKAPYCIGVEACYGARYLSGLTPEDSILLKAMTGGCVSFLGSSRIAYGKSVPTGSCADLVVGSYLRGIVTGESAGDAHLLGLERLLGDWSSTDDADVKTLAEFSLYGDPSVRKGARIRKGRLTEAGHPSRARVAKSITMPDVALAIRASVAEVDAKIEAIVDEFARREILPLLTGGIGAASLRTKVLRMSRNGLMQKMYFADTARFAAVAKVYFDGRGTIRKAVVSK